MSTIGREADGVDYICVSFERYTNGLESHSVPQTDRVVRMTGDDALSVGRVSSRMDTAGSFYAVQEGCLVVYRFTQDLSPGEHGFPTLPKNRIRWHPWESRDIQMGSAEVYRVRELV